MRFKRMECPFNVDHFPFKQRQSGLKQYENENKQFFIQVPKAPQNLHNKQAISNNLSSKHT